MNCGKNNLCLLLAILGAICLQTLPSAARNIVGNPDFENIRPDGAPADWIFFFPSASSGLSRAGESDFTIEQGDAPERAHTLRISSVQPVRASLQQSDLPLKPGQTLRFSVWMKGEGLEVSSRQGGWARLIFSNRHHRDWQSELDASTVYLKSPQSDFDWTLLEAEVSVPDKADRMTLDLFLWKTSGTVWYAQPSVTVLAGPPNPPDATGDSSGLDTFAAANKALLEKATKEPEVVFMGDSITHRWNLREYFPGKDWVNRGISGQATSQMLDRFADDVLQLKPRAVVILAGTNDIANGISNEAITANIAAMISQAQAEGIQPVVLAVLPVSDYHAADNPYFRASDRRPRAVILDLNRRLESLCRTKDVPFVDLYTIAADNSGQIPADWADDGLHPNALGYAAISPTVGEAVEAALSGRSTNL